MATPRDVKERLRDIVTVTGSAASLGISYQDAHAKEALHALPSLLSDSERLEKVDARLLEEIEKYESKIVGAQSDYMNITVLNVLKGIRAVLDAPSTDIKETDLP